MSEAQDEADLREVAAAAAQRSAIGRGLAEDDLRGAVLAGIGGWRGTIETLLPGVAFLLLYAFMPNIWVAIAASAGTGVLLLLIRLLQRSSVTQALGGLFAMGLSALLVQFSGRGENYFVIGFWTSAVLGSVFLVSLLIRRPLIGFLVGLLMEDAQWRADRKKFRAMTWLTAAWLTIFVIRLAVQLPVYFAGDVVGLASLKLVLGLPLTAPVLVLCFLVVRALYPKDAASQTR